MIGIYFKTHRLPVQFLIFIAITALSRHLVVDVQAVRHHVLRGKRAGGGEDTICSELSIKQEEL